MNKYSQYFCYLPCFAGGKLGHRQVKLLVQGYTFKYGSLEFEPTFLYGGVRDEAEADKSLNSDALCCFWVVCFSPLFSAQFFLIMCQQFVPSVLIEPCIQGEGMGHGKRLEKLSFQWFSSSALGMKRMLFLPLWVVGIHGYQQRAAGQEERKLIPCLLAVTGYTLQR